MDDNTEALSILNFLQDDSFSLPHLQDASKQIRLLEILPDVGLKDEICCTMKIGSLDDSDLRYTAISYTWGVLKPKKYIYIDGHPLQVQPNCWHALWQVKNNARPASTIQKERKLDHVYWVDAICINQQDIEEKSVQVGAMRRIYANAVSVAACIGYESHDSPLFDERFVRTWPTLASSEIRHQRHTMFELIEHLLCRPWFSRLWTVQESILAKDLQVFCGSRCVRWKMLRHQVELTRNSYSRPSSFRDLDQFFSDIDRSQTSGSGVIFPIADLIQRYSTRGCAVLHDKVYALLSMAQDYVQKRVVVNYEMSLFGLLWKYTESTSDHQIVDGQVMIKPDTPAAGTWTRYASISHLAESFCTDAVFIRQLRTFWTWRIGLFPDVSDTESPQKYLNASSAIYREQATNVHCHTIDLSVDRICFWERKFSWHKSDEFPEEAHSWREWRKDRVIVNKQLISLAEMVLDDDATRRSAQLLIVNCSDKPKYPGEIHYLLPSNAQNGDLLVPMQNPADRRHFHLVCRPVGFSQMPFQAEMVGLGIRVKEPSDSRAYMPWLRDKHSAEIFWRPHDLIALALLEGSGIHQTNLDRMQDGSGMASHITLRHATKEEIGY